MNAASQECDSAILSRLILQKNSGKDEDDEEGNSGKSGTACDRARVATHS
jgi:hypothetical protein